MWLALTNAKLADMSQAGALNMGVSVGLISGALMT